MTKNDIPEKRFVKLYETSDPQELSMVKLALKQEEIVYRTQFENTMHLVNVFAMGSNGAIVEVLTQDFYRAKHALTTLGIKLSTGGVEDQFGFVEKFGELTDGFPLIGNLEAGQRFFLFVMLLVVLSFGGLILFFLNA